jgi:hypothetical protein
MIAVRVIGRATAGGDHVVPSYLSFLALQYIPEYFKLITAKPGIYSGCAD